MKRICRWLFGAVIGVSLFLCLATGAIWLRSEFVADQAERLVNIATAPPTSQAQYEIRISTWHGQLWIEHGSLRGQPGALVTPPFGVVQWTYALDGYPRNDASFMHLGFSHRLYRSPGGSTLAWMNFDLYEVPFWAILAIFACPSAFSAVKFLRQRRCWSKPGYCRKCGYDLRATPDRCPECGTVPPK